MKLILRKGSLYFECPAQSCGLVRIPIERSSEEPNGPIWKLDGSLDKPTVTPSVKIEWFFGEDRKHNICHFNIIEGIIHFCNDCTHELRGQKVPMPDITADFEKLIAD